MAEIVGVSQQAVARWEAGRAIPGEDTLGRVAAAVGVDDLGLREGSLDLYDPIVDPFDARMRIRDRRFWEDDRLWQANVLALERELWPLAARDVRWEEPLAEALAWLAQDFAACGEHTLALEAAGRATRIAESNGCWDAVYRAVLAVSMIRDDRGASAASQLKFWRDYVGRVRHPLVRAAALMKITGFTNNAGDKAATFRNFSLVLPLVEGSAGDEMYDNEHPYDPIRKVDLDLMAINHALVWKQYDRAWALYEANFPADGDRQFDAPEFDNTIFMPIYVSLRLRTGQPLSGFALEYLDCRARNRNHYFIIKFLHRVSPQLGIYTPPPPRSR